MKISRNWLQKYVDLAGIPDSEIEAKVSERVAEVEEISKLGIESDKVVIGEILDIQPVPGADKIRVTQTRVGTETLQIVCGAPNIFVGARVPVALIGAVLPGDFRIEPRKMKGLDSQGMLCSAQELNLGADHGGIFLLDPAAPIGARLDSVVPADSVFSFENVSLTHRPDLFGHVGFARELAVIFDRELKLPEPVELPNLDQSELLKLKVEVGQVARFAAIRVAGAAVQESPEWLRAALLAAGMRPINNIVDATNFVMLELGQPMHAYDARQLAGGELGVRLARAGEEIQTLDGKTRTLTAEDLVIVDAEKPVGIAGIMGGANSEVAPDTTELILEVANFDATTIRRTSQRLSLRSEASTRFEKRLDPQLAGAAAMRFVEILRLTCPDLAIVAAADHFPIQPEQRSIFVANSEIERIIGSAVPASEIQRILTKLGFGVEAKDGGYQVAVPSHRAGRDIELAADIIEEIARHVGYNSIQPAMPEARLMPVRRDSSRQLAESARDILAGLGFGEGYSLALVSAEMLQKSEFDPAGAIQLQNPPNEDFRFLRPSLLPGLLEAAARNRRHFTEFRLFELNTIFAGQGESVQESRQLAGLIAGESEAYRRAVGALEQLLAGLHFAAEFGPETELPARAHPGRAARILIGREVVGQVFELHPRLAEQFDIPGAAVFQLDFERLAQLQPGIVQAREVPRFPGVARDISVLVDAKALSRELASRIKSASDLVESARLVDEFAGETIPAGKKALTFSIQLRDPDKTLTDETAEEILGRIRVELESTGATIR